jgi:hypothetical protein
VTTYRLRVISSRVVGEPRAGQFNAAAIARQKGSVALAMAGLKALRSPSRSLSKQRISNSHDGRENQCALPVVGQSRRPDII